MVGYNASTNQGYFVILGKNNMFRDMMEATIEKARFLDEIVKDSDQILEDTVVLASYPRSGNFSPPFCIV